MNKRRQRLGSNRGCGGGCNNWATASGSAFKVNDPFASTVFANAFFRQSRLQFPDVLQFFDALQQRSFHLTCVVVGSESYFSEPQSHQVNLNALTVAKAFVEEPIESFHKPGRRSMAALHVPTIAIREPDASIAVLQSTSRLAVPDE